VYVYVQQRQAQRRAAEQLTAQLAAANANIGQLEATIGQLESRLDDLSDLGMLLSVFSSNNYCSNITVC